MAQGGRSLYAEIWKNFIKSLRPKKYWGECKGKDSFGTEYYESTESLQGFKRPSRWFVPLKGNFDQEIPVEWQAWLRCKRKNPPTEEEIQYNLQKMEQTIANAKKLKHPETSKKDETISIDKPSFPIYEEYSNHPGLKK